MCFLLFTLFFCVSFFLLFSFLLPSLGFFFLFFFFFFSNLCGIQYLEKDAPLYTPHANQCLKSAVPVRNTLKIIIKRICFYASSFPLVCASSVGHYSYHPLIRYPPSMTAHLHNSLVSASSVGYWESSSTHSLPPSTFHPLQAGVKISGFSGALGIPPSLPPPPT